MPPAVFLSAYSIPQISSVVHEGFVSILWIIHVGTSVTRLTTVEQEPTAKPPCDEDGYGLICRSDGVFQLTAWSSDARGLQGISSPMLLKQVAKSKTNYGNNQIR